MDEEIVYNDDAVKITNLRVTCNHVTITIDKLDNVELATKSNLMFVAFLCLLLAFVPLFWFHIVPLLVVGVIAVIASLAWLGVIYQSFLNLNVLVKDKPVTMLSMNMGKKEYLQNIASTLSDTMIKEKERIENRKKEIEGGKNTSAFDPSETMKLRNMLKEYDEGKM